MKLNIQKILQKTHLPLKRTKITATIGPSSTKKEILAQHLQNGLNICRINFSHDDHSIQLAKLNLIRETISSNPLYKHTAIMLDTKGPEIRTCLLKDHKKIQLNTGQKILVGTDPEALGDSSKIHLSYPQLLKSVSVNSRILIADGNLTLKVLEINHSKNELLAEAQNSFLLGEKKNVNLPGAKIELPTITEKDEYDIVEFGLKHNVDFIALSFARSANDLKKCRELLKNSKIAIIPKIENQEGLLNLEEMLPLCEGVMLARGDLGMELYPQQMFAAQKYCTAKCQEFGKPMIVATQMMESMVENSRPTRAEITDVGNAVLDLNDGVMLSGETGNGKFPVESLLTQALICKETESHIDYQKLFSSKRFKANGQIEAFAYTAVTTAFQTDSQIVVCLTDDFSLIQKIAQLKPNAYIIFPSLDEQLLRHSQLYYGVIPLKSDPFNQKTVIYDVKTLINDFSLMNVSDSMVVVELQKNNAKLYLKQIN